MARYAEYDPSSENPHKVIGWYDTNEFRYPKLPQPTHMIEVTDSQWILHLTGNPNGWTVDNGALFAPAGNNS
jgi:hypothetical protein